MRVMLVSHRFPPDDFGGVESYTQRLAADLVRAGDTVSVVTRRWGGGPPVPVTVRERLTDGSSLHRFLGGGPRPDCLRLGNFLLYHEQLEHLFTAALLEEAPDVVHFNHLADLSPRFIEVARRLGVPVVLSLHDFYFACPRVHLQKPSGELCDGPDGGRECAHTCFADQGDPAARRWGLRCAYFLRWLLMAQRVVCYSRYVASYFERYGADPARLRVVANGVSFDPSDRPAPPAATPRERGTLKLAYCGTVEPHKGPHVLLDALRVAALGAVDLVLIGQCSNRGYVRRLREQAVPIAGLKLRFYGAYRRTDLPCLLNDVDCVVVPSLVPEAGPIVPREALALGVPVLASRLGALPEVVADGENGLLFDPSRPGELAALLQRLARDDDLVRRLREGARRTRGGTAPEHAQRMRAIYHEAADELIRGGSARSADVAEVQFLHAALLEAGAGGAPPQVLAAAH
jgi:glycosyltransferase involved in cell wall biosynthesis